MCMYMYISTYMFIHMYVCIYVYMYIYLCISYAVVCVYDALFGLLRILCRTGTSTDVQDGPGRQVRGAEAARSYGGARREGAECRPT